MEIPTIPEKQAMVVVATSDTEGKNDQLEHPVGAPNYTIEERIGWYTPLEFHR